MFLINTQMSSVCTVELVDFCWVISTWRRWSLFFVLHILWFMNILKESNDIIPLIVCADGQLYLQTFYQQWFMDYCRYSMEDLDFHHIHQITLECHAHLTPTQTKDSEAHHCPNCVRWKDERAEGAPRGTGDDTGQPSSRIRTWRSLMWNFEKWWRMGWCPRTLQIAHAYSPLWGLEWDAYGWPLTQVPRSHVNFIEFGFHII